VKLDDRVRALIAVGASISANCQPCLQATTAIALESGADAQEISEAVEVGKMVRHCAASRVDNSASTVDEPGSPPVAAKDRGCACG
jgi:AhpD family alkylhydroperoxidase